MDPSTKHVAAILGCIPIAVVIACFTAPEPDAAPPAGEGTVAEAQSQPVAAPRRVETGAERRGEPSPARRVSAQSPWTGEVPLPLDLKPLADRAVDRDASLRKRADRRAFDGAPPAMPHSASFGRGSLNCLDCHVDGMELGDRIARPMSHPPLAMCTQCHVETRHAELPAPLLPVESSFVGLRPPPLEDRAENGPPPRIPHGLLMRTRCLSCHGEFGYPGLQTSHPQRAMCVQCHVPDPQAPSPASERR